MCRNRYQHRSSLHGNVGQNFAGYLRTGTSYAIHSGFSQSTIWLPRVLHLKSIPIADQEFLRNFRIFKRSRLVATTYLSLVFAASRGFSSQVVIISNRINESEGIFAFFPFPLLLFPLCLVYFFTFPLAYWELFFLPRFAKMNNAFFVQPSVRFIIECRRL